jgi:hypothetical protein
MRRAETNPEDSEMVLGTKNFVTVRWKTGIGETTAR